MEKVRNVMYIIPQYKIHKTIELSPDFASSISADKNGE